MFCKNFLFRNGFLTSFGAYLIETKERQSVFNKEKWKILKFCIKFSAILMIHPEMVVMFWVNFSGRKEILKWANFWEWNLLLMLILLWFAAFVSSYSCLYNDWERDMCHAHVAIVFIQFHLLFFYLVLSYTYYLFLESFFLF